MIKKISHLIILSFLIISVFSSRLYSQYTNVKINKSTTPKPEEVTASINPENPLNLAAGANTNYYYYSKDGGLNWEEGKLTSTMGVSGDPCVLFDAEGNLYYSHLSSPISGTWLDRIVIQKSTDGGATWNDGIGVGYNPPKQQDKEWMAVDLSNSNYHNNLYISWTQFDKYGSIDVNDSSRIMFSRSTDSGKSWSLPIIISDDAGDCLDSTNTVEGAVPAVGPNGDVYISWTGPKGIMFDKSIDGGETFGKDIFVASQPGGWDFDISGISRCNGLPVTACDISNSHYRGTIYILWSDQRNGLNDTDIFLVKSKDMGKTWSNPIWVNNDTTARHQFFAWISVDPKTGIIYVVFYDRRNTAGDATDVYLAKSINGGNTFSNIKISDSSFTPSSKVFFGDYINVAALSGIVFPIWMRADSTSLSVWTAIINDTN